MAPRVASLALDQLAFILRSFKNPTSSSRRVSSRWEMRSAYGPIPAMYVSTILRGLLFRSRSNDVSNFLIPFSSGNAFRSSPRKFAIISLNAETEAIFTIVLTENIFKRYLEGFRGNGLTLPDAVGHDEIN